MTTLARAYVFPVWQTMSRWQGNSLMLMPAALASAVLLCATAILAAMVSDTVGKAIVDRYGATVALFADSIVAPRVQELARHSTLLDSKKEELDGLLPPIVIGRPIIAFRIWIDDQIIYSNNREMIGRRFPLSPARARAWEGGVSTELNQLDGDDEVPIGAPVRTSSKFMPPFARPVRVKSLRLRRPTKLRQTCTTRCAQPRRWCG